MKRLNETFTPAEFARLKAGKGDRTWREALLEDVAGPQEALE